MNTLVFFLEEPSAAEMLKGLESRIIPPGVAVDYKVFEGKQDLEKRLPKILRAWKKPNCLFLVMRDQDSGDCLEIKRNLVELCRRGDKENVMIRIACHELESFYLGDLAAAEQGLGLNGLRNRQKQVKFRNPDVLGNPAQEMYRLTDDIYDKVSGSRAIAPYLDLRNNRSHSFNILLSGIKRLLVND